ncbi:MAG: CorA family divalent cation transporter, partial [Clostridia bacterium]|nr:CorA family divalent cation transporter [Clostridia bacterium]
YLRKSVYPLRELIGGLVNSDSALLSQEIRIYLHDVYDHLIQIVDSIETYQDILSNMLDTYLSSISNRTNDTMKILTIISTIFIPLTFLAGIYGMNFKNIPELSLPYGYLVFWVISAVIVVLMILFFHKKKWF